MIGDGSGTSEGRDRLASARAVVALAGCYFLIVTIATFSISNLGTVFRVMNLMIRGVFGIAPRVGICGLKAAAVGGELERNSDGRVVGTSRRRRTRSLGDASGASYG